MNSQEIVALWRLIGQTWGTRFLEQYGSDPNEAWSEVLSQVDAIAARSALRSLVMEGSPHPPTLPEFVAVAKRHRLAKMREMSSAELLENLRDKRTPADAQANIEKLRETLSTFGKPT